MAIEKALQSILGEPSATEGVTIQIENPESVSLETEDGGMLIDFNPEVSEVMGISHGGNLVEIIEDNDLDALASDLVSQFNADNSSRKDWQRTYVKGLKLLGLEIEEKTSPWNGACGVNVMSEQSVANVKGILMLLYNHHNTGSI